MKKKRELYDENSMKANIIRYWVQDMLDGISSGNKIDLDKFEKKVLKRIKLPIDHEVKQ
jgi:hypothetical protein